MSHSLLARRTLTALLVLALLIPQSVAAVGLCSVYRTWSTGDSLTAADLNTSFTTVGVTNSVPACIDDYSPDVTTMQSATDPYPAGVESLATSLAGELQRIRYVLKQLGGGAQWYTTLSLTNKTGGSLAVGDVVAVDAANASAVKLDDTASSQAVFVVALDAPANNALGRFRSAGQIQAVNVSNATTIGHYLTKSATSKQAQDSATASGAATAPPTGALGVALTSTAGAGSVTAMWFGTPVAAAVESGTWSDASGSRALNTVYQNTSGRKRRLAITVQMAGDAGNSGSLFVGSANPPTLQAGRAGFNATYGTANVAFFQLYAEVPNNHYYKLTQNGTISIGAWLELDE